MTTKQQRTLTVVAVIAAIIMLGYAGRVDYTDAVMNTMSESEYKAIKERLGEGATDYEIANFYQKNKEECK